MGVLALVRMHIRALTMENETKVTRLCNILPVALRYVRRSFSGRMHASLNDHHLTSALLLFFLSLLISF